MTTEKRPYNNRKEPRKKLRGSSHKYRRRRYSVNLRRLIPAAIFAAVFVYAFVSLVIFGIRSISTKRTNASLQDMFADTIVFATAAPAAEETPSAASEPAPAATPEPELLAEYQYMGGYVLPWAEKLLSNNPDTIAWLEIPDVVSLPVVYRDNSYYLDHDFNGKKNKSGTLFLDEAHYFARDTQYFVIHGHNMFDGSMFGLVSHYRKEGYMDAHPTVYLNTLYREEEYEVVGVLYIPIDVRAEGFVAYIGQRRFDSTEHFYDFAGKLYENALYWKEGAELLPTDAILALSTCYEDYRIVVICRRVAP